MLTKKHRIEDEDVYTVKIGAYKEDMQKDMFTLTPDEAQYLRTKISTTTNVAKRHTP